MQKITTYLWFDDNAEEAIEFYTSIFKNSHIVNKSRYSKVGPGPEGSVMSITFELEGQEFMALNGGPDFKFNEAISLFVKCNSQHEVDYYWEALTAGGGQESHCGWLKDKFGLSWQITPTILPLLLSGPDTERSQQAMTALLKMKKIDIKALKRAYNQ